MALCTFEKGEGGRCRAQSLAGGAFCFFHDPSKQDERARANLAGGKMRAKLREKTAGSSVTDPDAPEITFNTEADVLRVVAQTMTSVRRGHLGAKTGVALFQGAGVALKALDQGKTDDRLKALEEQVRPLKGLTAEQLLEIVRAGDDQAPGAH